MSYSPVFFYDKEEANLLSERLTIKISKMQNTVNSIRYKHKCKNCSSLIKFLGDSWACKERGQWPFETFYIQEENLEKITSCPYFWCDQQE